MPLLIRCSRCGHDAPGDSTACPRCGYAGGKDRLDWSMVRPWLYGAIAAAIEMGIVLAWLRC